MVVIAGDARILGFGRRDASAEVDRLYRRHADEVLRYVLLVLRSRTDAEDVVQATFIRAFRALARGERVQKPRNWLIKIAHNECRRALATRSRRAVEVELEEVPVEQAESGRAESLRAALSLLTSKQREALVLRELEGRSYSEIATTLEVTESAVETLLFRARRAVREQLEDQLGCDAACALIEQETLSDAQRRLLRAHTRACSDCSTVERQARGRKGALRRIASSFGLPGFCKTLLGKFLVVAVTASAVGVTGVAIADPPARRLPDVAPLQVDRPQIPPVVGPRHANARARARAVRARPVLGRPTRPSAGSPARAHRRVTAAPVAAPVAPPPAAAPAATPEPAAASLPPRPLPPRPPPQRRSPCCRCRSCRSSSPCPRCPSPELPPPPVAVPPVPAPTVELPTLPLDLPVATPQVPGLPSVP